MPTSRFLRASAFIVAALVAAPTALEAQLSPAMEKAVAAVRSHYTKREVLIPMRDGVKLFTAIYTPKDTSKTYPFLLNRTPYSVWPYGEDAYPPELGPSARFQEVGFIFVFQDVRGKMMSEGEFVNMRPQRAVSGAVIDESTDTYDTLEWLVKHVPGNNGRAGQMGISYPGFYSAVGMLSGHPALKAVSPQAPIVDWFQGDDFHRNGALWLPHAFNFMTSFGQPRPKPTQAWPEGLNHGTSDGYEWFMRLGSTGATRQYTKNVPFWNEMLDHPNYDAFWQARNLRPQIKDVKPAVLTVGGWFDAENLYGALQVHQTVNRQSPGTDNRLVMGPWFHGGWERSKGDHLGPVQFGANTSDWFQTDVLLPFFNHHLKDAKAPDLAKATVFETGANRWHKLDAWPPRQAREKKLYLLPAGKLGFEPPAAAAEPDMFISDPAKAVPFIENVAIGMTREYMSADQRFAGRRPDVLVYQTEALAEDLTFAGPLHPELFVATTGTDADWVVKLVDVYPDDFKNSDFKAGNSPWDRQPNPMGGYQQLVRGEVMRGKFRNSLEKPEPFTPGQPARVAWSMNDVFHTFKKGHRVMVQLQSTWFPLMDRNPQTFMDINQAKPEDYHKATHSVFHDAERPSNLGVGVVSEKL
ncbi:CocE/NonD family hydrolase [Geothrix sp. PMB-07]|uniref:CocE/NonD family hydrolase n=1 Tax=Geothrix sp. PMB-07 TaxID=3068640 RepID=UPI002741082C|nr:CocE/NonD family hydrolase [Geothrix sp. PMB-07]WLT31652.1 CocE/NonD family hydrolase [Geothrix sp. PMB-07]